MGSTLSILNHVRSLIAPADSVLDEARRRRDAVAGLAKTFPGVLRTYVSGSIAAALANKPVDDADGGVVLDRRAYPELGPDGGDELPTAVVKAVQAHIGPDLRELYPRARVAVMKRGLLATVSILLEDDQDPSVDLVVALTRKDAPGLWIPNMDQGRWDPSDPERHVELLLAGPTDVRRVRAWVIRLAKAWNHGASQPAFCSFNLAALGLEAITEVEPLDVALLRFFEHSATALAHGLTEDPAGVSGPIKLPLGKDRAIARVTNAANKLQDALNVDDDPDKVGEILASLFPEQLSGPEAVRVAWAAELRNPKPRVGIGATTPLAVGGAAVAVLKPARSYGG